MPLGLTLDWAADYEIQTARVLSKKHVVIIFAFGEGGSLRQYIYHPFNLLEKKSSNLFVFRPLYVIPFQRLSFVRALNATLASIHLKLLISSRAKWKNLHKIFWTFSLQYAIFPRHFGSGYLAIYDCVDAFTSERPEIAVPWKLHEATLIKQSDIVLTNSETLYQVQKKKHRRVFRTGEGLFALDIFARAHLREPNDLMRIPHPRILFVGNINARLDFRLVDELARKTPHVSYVFVGKEDPIFDGRAGVRFANEIHALKRIQNIYFLGVKPKQSIPSYIRYSDIGYIPYDLRLTFNKLCYPMKIQEYFYMGKPVISTPIPEAKKLAPYLKTFTTAVSAAKTIRELLSRPWPPAYKKIQRKIAVSNSIQHKVRLVSALLLKHFPDRV